MMYEILNIASLHSNFYHQNCWQISDFLILYFSLQPIIPFFTKNAREAFLTPKFGRPILRWLYEKTRGPLVPIYGGFPVKLE